MWSLFDSIEVITVTDSARISGLKENLAAAQFDMKDVTINTFERGKKNRPRTIACSSSRL